MIVLQSARVYIIFPLFFHFCDMICHTPKHLFHVFCGLAIIQSYLWQILRASEPHNQPNGKHDHAAKKAHTKFVVPQVAARAQW